LPDATNRAGPGNCVELSVVWLLETWEMVRALELQTLRESRQILPFFEIVRCLHSSGGSKRKRMLAFKTNSIAWRRSGSGSFRKICTFASLEQTTRSVSGMEKNQGLLNNQKTRYTDLIEQENPGNT
jgi:hypothetical protein